MSKVFIEINGSTKIVAQSNFGKSKYFYFCENNKTVQIRMASLKKYLKLDFNNAKEQEKSGETR